MRFILLLYNSTPLCLGAMTLVGKSNFALGRVRLFYEGQWGAICFQRANIDTAAIVCRQLGFPTALDMAATFVGEQPNLTYWIGLTGVEPCLQSTAYQFSRIEQCEHNGWRIAPVCADSLVEYDILCASK